jgi:hypothetical protein
MISFAVTTFDGEFHEFAAEEVDAGGSDLSFRTGGQVVRKFAKADVLCWDSDLRGRLKLRELPGEAPPEPEGAPALRECSGGSHAHA